MKSEIPNPDQKVLLHLSDIHFNKRTSNGRYDPDKDLRNELERDAQRMLKKLGVIHGILVTGDIAYGGQKEEYDIAANWLDNLCQTLNCSSEFVWTVPGNHDVDRSVIESSQILQMFRRDLRGCSLQELNPKIAQLMSDEIARKVIYYPLESYNKFATQYSCNIDADNPSWHQNIVLNDGSQIRILGLNSVLVSDRLDNNMQHKLLLGSAQSLPERIDGVEYLVMCHHPPDWLRDQDSVHAHLTNRACIQLFGHKHSHQVNRIENTIRISAGAVHPERQDFEWNPRYNVITLFVKWINGSRHLSVTIYPRVWSNQSMSFIGDFDGDGNDYRHYLIPLSEWSKSETDAIVGQQGFAENTGEIIINRPVEIIVNNSDDVLDLVEEVTSDSSSMNKARRLTYRFMSLPYLERLKIAQELELIHDEDEGIDESVLLILLFRRAKENNLLAALWEAVENSHSDSFESDNPFAGS